MNGTAGSVVLYVEMGHELGGHGIAPLFVSGQHEMADHAYLGSCVFVNVEVWHASMKVRCT
jgi:hypothetical protein